MWKERPDDLPKPGYALLSRGYGALPETGVL